MRKPSPSGTWEEWWRPARSTKTNPTEHTTARALPYCKVFYRHEMCMATKQAGDSSHSKGWRGWQNTNARSILWPDSLQAPWACAQFSMSRLTGENNSSNEQSEPWMAAAVEAQLPYTQIHQSHAASDPKMCTLHAKYCHWPIKTNRCQVLEYKLQNPITIAFANTGKMNERTNKQMRARLTRRKVNCQTGRIIAFWLLLC